MLVKTCSKCNIKKPISEFHRKTRGRSSSKCNFCSNFCSFLECENKTNQKYCSAHRMQFTRTGEMKPIHYFDPDKPCEVEGCKRKVRSSKKFCSSHYNLVRAVMMANQDDDRGCEVPECKFKHHAKNMCHMHYNQDYILKKYSKYV